MLTLRFESDARTSESGDITFMVETPSFRTRQQKGGAVDILIPNENGVDISHPVSGTLGGYDRCFVMNGQGATVARYVPGPVMVSEQAA